MKKTLLFALVFFFLKTAVNAQSTELTAIKTSLPHLSDSLRYVDALNRMAILLYEKNIDSTFYYTIKAREIADRLNYEKGKADALNNLGIFFDIKGNLQLALRYYDEAYLGYTNLKDTGNRVQTLMNIAMVYKEIGKDKKAIQRFNSALSLGKKLAKDSIMSLAIYNYLLQYPTQYNEGTNDKLIKNARQIAIKYKDARTLLAIDQLIADDLIANGKTKEGLTLLANAIDSAISKKMYYVSMDMLIDIGDQLLATAPEKAIGYYQKALIISNQNGYLIYSKLITRKLFEFYTAHHQYNEATAYAKQLLKVLDEQEKVDNQSGIDYLDYALKDQQVKSLVTRNNYQTGLLALSIIAFILAIVIIISIRQHLTRTKRLNEMANKQNIAMKKTLSALEQSQADNTKMMKIAAHDLRNPINGIYSLATIMLAEPNHSPEDIEMLEIIKTSGQNSLALVSDLLEVQFNTKDFKKEPVDISEILHHCVALLQNKAAEKHQTLNLQHNEFIVPANREKLWRVMSNLISNAIKFSPEGEMIDIKMESNVDGLLIMVKDNGIGIPPEMHDKIFDMFTEAKRQGTAGEQTYGLGLAISKQIVEAHNGKIWFESSLSRGTTFYVTLPLN